MATMRALLSEIDLVSAGEVVYPPGGRLGPRWQRDVQLVLVHEGSARVAIDGSPPSTRRFRRPSLSPRRWRPRRCGATPAKPSRASAGLAGRSSVLVRSCTPT